MLQKIIEKISSLAVEYPLPIIIIFLLITLLSLYNLQAVELDTAIKSQIPEDMPSRTRIEEIENIFGGTEMIMLTVEAEDVLEPELLRKLKFISDELEKLREVDQVNSPFTVNIIEGRDDELLIESAVSNIPEAEAEKESLRERLQKSELAMGSVFARNFKAVNIAVILAEDFDDAELMTKIDNILAEADSQFAAEEKVLKTGLPIMRALNAEIMQHDMRILMPLGLVIMLIFLFLCFKQLRGVFLPFIVVVMSIIFSLSLLPLLGWKFQLLTVILPVILIAVTNDYGIHIIAAYQELAVEEKNSVQLSQDSVLKLGAPVIAAGITTVVGLLSLSTHLIVPARELGVLAGAGITFALFASLLFIPAVLSLLKVKTPLQNFKSGSENRNESPQKGIITRMLFKIADLVGRKAKTILVVSLLIVLFISAGILMLQVDTNPISFYEKESDIVRATEIVNQHFGGANTISVVARGKIKEAEMMQQISDFELKIKEFENVGEVSAVSTIIRTMNRELHNGQPEFEKIPTDDFALSQYLLLFSMSGDLDKMIDFREENALLTARIKTNSTEGIREVLNKIQKEAQSYGEGTFHLIGGFGDLLSELVNAVVRGQLISLFLSIILVAAVVMLLFKSFTAGLYAAVPLVTALVTLFSLMGFLNIKLDMITTMLSSIMIGVGVDYTIHFLWRYREERRNLAKKEAVIKTLTTSGRGITFNALSVIVGFSILFVSGFLPVKFFAFLVTVSIATCLIGALLILPALVLVFEPEFLENNR
ncbi:MAG: efflux RND transporter permease subunit [Halanaerobium sp.]